MPIDKHILDKLRRNDESLKQLDLRNKHLAATDIQLLCEALKENMSLQKLSLERNSCGNEGAKYLAEALAKNRGLQTFNLEDNLFLGDEGIKSLAEGLSKNTTLRILDLGNNLYFGVEGIKSLILVLAKNTALKTLNLRKGNVGDEGMKYSAEALAKNTALQTLDLGGNNLGDESMKFLAGGLAKNTALQTLNLDGNNLGDESMKFLAEALAKNTDLQTLNLGGNKLGIEGMKYLAGGLVKNTGLQTLNLDRNNLGDESMKFLAEGLSRNTNLQTLNLRGNNLGAEGMKYLAGGLAKNTGLQTLDLDGNNLGDESMKFLAEALAKNTDLQTLNLGGNKLGIEGMKYLAGGLVKNTGLQTLHLGENKLGIEGMQFLAEALLTNTSLQMLYFDVKKFGYQGIKSNELTAQIDCYLQRNKKIAEERKHLANNNNNHHTLPQASVSTLLIVEPKTSAFQQPQSKAQSQPITQTVYPSSKPISSNSNVLAKSTPLLSLPWAQVLYDYMAQSSDELTVKAGDKVEQLSEQDPAWSAAGWVYCQKGNLKGYVSKSYLKAMSAAPVSNYHATTTTSLNNPAQKVPLLNTLAAAVESVKANTTVNANNHYLPQNELIKKIEEQQLKLNQETFSDYQKLSYELQQQAQTLKQSQEAELKSIRAEIEKTKAELKKHPEQAELEARVKQLEEKQTPLVAAYEAQKALSAQQAGLLSQESLARFYRVLQGNLHRLFAACDVIDSGLVVRKEVGKAEKAERYINLAGEAIPLPGARAVGKCLGYIVKKIAGQRADKKLHDIADQVVSFAEIDKLTEEVARQLAVIYEEQLLQLSSEQATILAESAMKLMLAYLWAGEFNEETLSEQLIHSVACIKTSSEHSQGLIKLRRQFEELKDKFQDKNLTTKLNEKWTAFGVFRCPGIEVKIEKTSCYYSGQGTHPDIYGYRQGSQAEAESAKLNKTANRIDLRVGTELLKKQVAHLANQLAAFSPNQSGASSSSPLFHQAPHVTKQTTMVKESVAGVMIEGLALSLDLTSIPQDKRDSVNTLMEDYSENCKEKDIARNGKGKIVALTLPTNALVQKLEEKLLALLDKKPVTKNTH